MADPMSRQLLLDQPLRPLQFLEKGFLPLLRRLKSALLYMVPPVVPDDFKKFTVRLSA